MAMIAKKKAGAGSIGKEAVKEGETPAVEKKEKAVAVKPKAKKGVNPFAKKGAPAPKGAC
jgi:hypothetical protein